MPSRENPVVVGPAGINSQAVSIRLLVALAVVFCLTMVQAGGASAQSLTEVLATAHSTNPALLAARNELRAQNELVPQALSGWRPTIQQDLFQVVDQCVSVSLPLPPGWLRATGRACES